MSPNAVPYDTVARVSGRGDHRVLRSWGRRDRRAVVVPAARGVPGPLPGPGGWPVAVQDFRLVLVPRGRGAVRVQDQGPALLVDHDLVVEKQSRTQSLALVLPPCFLCLTWCTSHADAGWLQPPATGTCGPAGSPRYGSRPGSTRSTRCPAAGSARPAARPAAGGARSTPARPDPTAGPPPCRSPPAPAPPGPPWCPQPPGCRSRGCPGAPAGVSARRRRSSSTHSRTQDLQRLYLHVPGHDRGHRRVARDRLGGVAVEPGALDAGLGPNARRAAHRARTCAVDCSAERSRRRAAAGPPARYAPRPSPGRPARSGQARQLRAPAAAIARPARRGTAPVPVLLSSFLAGAPSASSTRPTTSAISGRHLPVHDPGAAERDRQLQGLSRRRPGPGPGLRIRQL